MNQEVASRSLAGLDSTAALASRVGEQALLEQVLAIDGSAARVADAMVAAVVPVPVLLGNVCKALNCRFTLGGDALPPSYVMAPGGMLSCVAVLAQETAHRLLDADLACSLRRDERSLFGVQAVVPPVTGNLADIVRGLVFIHSARTLYGLRRDALIDVTEVLKMFEGEFKEMLARPSFDESGDFSWPLPLRPL